MTSERNGVPARGEGPVDRVLVAALPLLLLLYAVVAISVQSTNKIPAWYYGSPMKSYIAGALWMLSYVCLLIAVRERGVPRRSALWWLACAAGFIGGTAEIWVFRNPWSASMRTYLGGSGSGEFVAWLATGAALWVFWRAYRPPRPVAAAMVAGFLIHTAWAMEAKSHGTILGLHVDIHALRWFGGVLELLAAEAYLLACLFLYTVLLKRVEPGRPEIQRAG